MPSRRSEASIASRMYSGRLSTMRLPSTVRLANLVAMMKSSRRPATAWPTSSSLAPAP